MLHQLLLKTPSQTILEENENEHHKDYMLKRDLGSTEDAKRAMLVCLVLYSTDLSCSMSCSPGLTTHRDLTL